MTKLALTEMRPRAAVLLFENRYLWWLRIFRKGFRHVSVVLQLDADTWVHIDPMLDGWSVNKLKATEVREMIESNMYSYRWVRTKAYTKRFLPFPVTCVEAVKRIVGLNKWWIWTPYQLYKTKEL